MQITIELPDVLGMKFKSLPDPEGFIVRILSELLEKYNPSDSWQDFSAISDFAIKYDADCLTEQDLKELRIAEAEFEAGETISFDDVREKWLKGENAGICKAL